MTGSVEEAQQKIAIVSVSGIGIGVILQPQTIAKLTAAMERIASRVCNRNRQFVR